MDPCPICPSPDEPPRERADAARNRALVLQAAWRLYTHGGVEALTTDAVAQEAGVGKGTVYRRFRDKSGLVSALLDDKEKELQLAMISGPPPLGPDAATQAERRVAFVHAYLDYLQAHLDLLLASETAAPGARYRLGVYQFWKTHLTMLFADDPRPRVPRLHRPGPPRRGPGQPPPRRRLVLGPHPRRRRSRRPADDARTRHPGHRLAGPDALPRRTTPTSSASTSRASCSTPARARSARCSSPACPSPRSPACASPTSTATTPWACPASCSACPWTTSRTKWSATSPASTRSTSSASASPPRTTPARRSRRSRPPAPASYALDGGLTLTVAPLDHGMPCQGYRLDEADGVRMLPREAGRGRHQGPRHLTPAAAEGRLGDVETRRRQRPAARPELRLPDGHPPLRRRRAARGRRRPPGRRGDLPGLRGRAGRIQFGHLTARQAARLAADAGVRELVLTHFSQRYPIEEAPARYLAEAAEEFDGLIHIAEDLSASRSRNGAEPRARASTSLLRTEPHSPRRPLHPQRERLALQRQAPPSPRSARPPRTRAPRHPHAAASPSPPPPRSPARMAAIHAVRSTSLSPPWPPSSTCPWSVTTITVHASSANAGRASQRRHQPPDPRVRTLHRRAVLAPRRRARARSRPRRPGTRTPRRSPPPVSSRSASTVAASSPRSQSSPYDVNVTRSGAANSGPPHAAVASGSQLPTDRYVRLPGQRSQRQEVRMLREPMPGEHVVHDPVLRRRHPGRDRRPTRPGPRRRGVVDTHRREEPVGRDRVEVRVSRRSGARRAGPRRSRSTRTREGEVMETIPISVTVVLLPSLSSDSVTERHGSGRYTPPRRPRRSPKPRTAQHTHPRT